MAFAEDSDNATIIVVIIMEVENNGREGSIN